MISFSIIRQPAAGFKSEAVFFAQIILETYDPFFRTTDSINE
jgi:hypothetical protein